MEMICKQCALGFLLDPQDLEFYKKISPKFGSITFEMPLPSLCPDCRNRRRMMFRNDRTFYKRKCDLSGQQFVSIFSPEYGGKVYHPDAWYGDKWDAMDFGRDFDFNRPFFDQFHELMLAVPRLGINIVNCQNSYYCNYCSDNKDCYLDIAGEANEDSYYNLFVKYSKNVVDSTFTYNSELCYECINCYDCYNVQNSMYCENSNDCYFCYDLIGCKNCIFSSGLRNKQYCIFNEQKTKEEYESYLASLHLVDYEQRMQLQQGWTKFKLENAIFRGSYLLNCENCDGNDLKNSKNTHYSFNALNCEDSKYLYDVLDAKDCQDLNYSLYKPELSYELISSLNMVKSAFSLESHYNNEVYYSEMLDNSANLFGCSALRHKQYCIFNKQYTKGEYEELVPRIIEHMKAHDEWGEFFPSRLSAHAYNETVAQEYFPLDESRAQKLDLKWRSLSDGKADKFKVIEQEKKFYAKMNIPEPRFSPDKRHSDRSALRNPRKLWARKCDKCHVDLRSSFAPQRKEKVYCDQCYKEAIY